MTGPRPTNPFRWYLGKAVPLRSRTYVVEQCEIDARGLSFVLRDPQSGALERLSAMELVGLESQDPWLASLDLEYHNVDPSRGLFRGLEAEGRVARVVGDAEVEHALREGPADTRGGIRGACVRRFAAEVTAVQWERVQARTAGVVRTLDLSALFDPAAVEALHDVLGQAASFGEAVTQWERRKDQI